ncbi:MAG: carbonic anhydrase [Cyanobacteria bacterium]|nr:carbonic anhydrase [Cyanobacteriota bacterium]
MELRRRELLLTAGWWGIGSLCAKPAAAAAEPAICRPDDPLAALLDGNRLFMRAWRAAADDPSASLQHEGLRLPCRATPDQLLLEQHPWATVLTCADSRVSPTWIFNTSPGDLFVIRSAGNTAFAEAIASIEYSVSVLHSPLVMVMGHTGCGAVAAAMDDTALSPSLEQLVAPIRDQIGESDDPIAAVRANARGSTALLRQRSSSIRNAEDRGALKLVSSCFDLASGAVTLI